MTTRRSFTWGASALGLTLAAPGILRAQSYPSRPVRMLVGFAPGGPTDIVARQLAQYMTEPLGQSIVIENRGGANGNIAAQEIASAAPDGYNLFYNTSAIAISPALYPRLGYDVKSFVPVGLTATVPMVLEVHPQMPVNTVDEFVAYVKANADKLSYASTGNGSIPISARRCCSGASAPRSPTCPIAAARRRWSTSRAGASISCRTRSIPRCPSSRTAV